MHLNDTDEYEQGGYEIEDAGHEEEATVTMHDMYEPEEIARRMLTDRDKEIRATGMEKRVLVHLFVCVCVCVCADIVRRYP